MKIDGVVYELDWREFRIGSSFFIPCVGTVAGKQLIENKMRRLGFTVIVKLWEEPIQPFNVGVTVMVATFGVALVFNAVKLGMVPEPFATNPILGVLFTQL